MLVEVVPGETYIVQDSTDLGEWADYFEFTPDRVNHVLSFAPRPNGTGRHFFRIRRK